MAEPAWSPDGAWLSVRELAGDGQPPALETIEVATARTVLSSNLFGSALWSPAEDRIAYLTPEGAVIASPDASDSVSLAGVGSIAWSSDGTQLAYAQTNAAGGGLWVVDSDGTNAREIPMQ